MGEFDAVVVAMAALERLGLRPTGLHALSADEMVPQAGQGALAVECLGDNEKMRSLLSTIEHAPSRRCVDAERAFLAGIGGDCSLPLAAHAVLTAGRLRLTAVLATGLGGSVCRDAVEGDVPEELGAYLAQRLEVAVAGAGDGSIDVAGGAEGVGSGR